MSTRSVAGGALLVPFQDVKKFKIVLESANLLSRSCKIRRFDDNFASLPLTSHASCLLELGDAAEELPESLSVMLDEGCARYVSAVELPVTTPVEPKPCFQLSPDGEDGDGTGPLKFAELFAGVGGFRLALESLGLDCVCAVEIERSARRIYALNFALPMGVDGRRVLLHDVTRLHSKDVRDHDLLTAGFPCQPFSAVSTRETRLGLTRNYAYLSMIRIIHEKQPRALLLENVRGLLTMDEGRVFDTVKTDLEQCGYKIWHRCIDAVVVVPQTRKRVYIVGLRNDVVEALEDGDGFEFPFPELAASTNSVYDILEDEDGEEDTHFEELSDSQWEKVTSTSYFKKFPEARLVQSERPSPDTGARMVAQTVQASYRSGYQLYSQFVAPSGGRRRNPRFFTPREVCRLQGFPETFVWSTEQPRIRDQEPRPMSCNTAVKDEERKGREPSPSRKPHRKESAKDTHSIYRHLGHAVVPPLIKELGRKLVELLEEAGAKEARR